MMAQRLSPGVEDGNEADQRSEVPGVGADRLEGVRRRPEEEGIHEAFVLQSQRRNRFGDGEDDVEILAVEEFRVARLDPPRTRQGLTLGAVPIAARVVGDALVPARVALLDMAAERGGATRRNRPHDAPLGAREAIGVLLPIAVSVAAKDVRHFKRGPCHGRLQLRSRRGIGGHGREWCRARQYIERARRRADFHGGDPEIAGRGVETPMPEQKLNGANVGARFEEMDGERMAEGMRMDRFRQPRSPVRQLAGPSDRAGRNGVIRILTRKQPMPRAAPLPPVAQDLQQAR